MHLWVKCIIHQIRFYFRAQLSELWLLKIVSREPSYAPSVIKTEYIPRFNYTFLNGFYSTVRIQLMIKGPKFATTWRKGFFLNLWMSWKYLNKTKAVVGGGKVLIVPWTITCCPRSFIKIIWKLKYAFYR